MPYNRWAGISGSLALHALAAMALWAAWRVLGTHTVRQASDEVPSIMLQEGFAQLPDAPGIVGNDVPDSPPPAPVLQEQLRSFAWQPVEIRLAAAPSEPAPAASVEDLGQPRVAARAASKVQDDGSGSASGGNATSAGGSSTGNGNGSGAAGRGSPSGNSGAGTFGGLGISAGGGRRGGGATLVPLPGNQMPAYPIDSLHRFEEGSVRVRLVVEPTGRVGDVQVVRSSGFGELDAAAVAAVKRWRFEALGVSQNLMAEQDIQFRLQGAQQVSHLP